MSHTHHILAELLLRIKCKPGWEFRLETPKGDHYPKLVITVPGYDSAQALYTDAIIREAIGLLGYQDQSQMIRDTRLTRLQQHVKHHRDFVVSHWFPVPEATYTETAWRRWVFECCRGVENHEIGEWFRDGADRPFSPLHGPGENPYVVHEFRPIDDMLTTQSGYKREPYK